MDTHELAVQAKVQAEAGKIAAEATQRATITASKSLQSTVDNFHLDQRAWIGLARFPVVSFAKAAPFEVSFVFFNHGKTPAINTTEGASTFYSATTPNPFRMPVIPQPAETVGPQEEYLMIYKVLDWPSNYDSVMRGEKFLYLHGEFTYHDIYGSTVHHTKFCVILDTFRQPFGLNFCIHGLEMD